MSSTSSADDAHGRAKCRESAGTREAAAAARWDGTDLILRIQVQPRASRNELAGLHGDRLKVRLTAPPVDGRANAALIAFLADLFGVPKNCVTVLAGETGRTKRVRIQNPSRIPAQPGLPARPGI